MKITVWIRPDFRGNIERDLTMRLDYKYESLDTPVIPDEDFDTLFHADLGLTVTFADGSEKTVWAYGAMSNRSVRQVAKYALADPDAGLSPAARERLRTLFPN